MTETELPEKMVPFYEYLNKLDSWLNEVPPIEQPMRFGNRAFRTWLTKIIENADQDIAAIIQAGNPNFNNYHRAIPELKEYLIESFGSFERIDYGTGHEFNFFVFIYCLSKIGLFYPSDQKALVNKIFARYLDLMRRLQTYYFLEPAGSHGVWGLDDY